MKISSRFTPSSREGEERADGVTDEGSSPERMDDQQRRRRPGGKLRHGAHSADKDAVPGDVDGEVRRETGDGRRGSREEEPNELVT